MYIDNSIFVLIAIQTLKSKENLVLRKEIEDFLPLENSHISQCLRNNEEEELIKKPNGERYFKTIQITPKGIVKAKRYITFLNDLNQKINNNSNPKKKEQKTPPKKELKKDPPVRKNFGKLIEEFSSQIQTPLKSSIRDSLSDYIPESHIDNGLLDDLTGTTIDAIYEHLSTFFKDIFT